MITGRVRNDEAIIEVEMAGAQPSQPIEALIDTGYNGSLALSSQLVAALQLVFAGYRSGILADGSVVNLEVYFATVVWHGQQRDVLACQAEGTPLVGMSLLRGNRLMMDVIHDGEVVISELPASNP